MFEAQYGLPRHIADLLVGAAWRRQLSYLDGLVTLEALIVVVEILADADTIFAHPVAVCLVCHFVD